MCVYAFSHLCIYLFIYSFWWEMTRKMQNEMSVVLSAIPIWIALVVVTVVVWRKNQSEGVRFWLVNGALAFVFSGIMRGHHGGYINVLMPALWMMSLWGGLLLSSILNRLPKLQYGLLVIMAAQLYVGIWSPKKYIPTDKDYEAGTRLIERLEQTPKPAFSPFSPWYTYKAGHPPSLHLIALWDIDHAQGVLKDEVEAIEQTIRNKEWSAIVLANDRFDYGRKKNYPKKEVITELKGRLRPKVGWPAAPRFIYFPKSDKR